MVYGLRFAGRADRFFRQGSNQFGAWCSRKRFGGVKMLRFLTNRRGQCAVLAACATPFMVGRALGGIDFDETNSSVKITHYAERDNAGTFGSKSVNPPPASG